MCTCLYRKKKDLVQITMIFSLKITLITGFLQVFCSASSKGHSRAHLQKYFARELGYIAIYLL